MPHFEARSRHFALRPCLDFSPILGLKSFMRVIAIRNLRDFWEIHPAAEVPLKAWLDEARAARWQTPSDIKARYANASILKSRRVVFNIKGNDYRLIAAVAYRFGAIYIKFVGTHKQYAAVNADTVEIGS